MPDVATDVSSTFLRLHAARENYAEDQDFLLVKDALSQLRGYMNREGLRRIMTDPPKAPKTVRRYFKERNFAGVHLSLSRKGKDVATGAQEGKTNHYHADTSHAWRTYYVKLLVLAQARRWLSATEQLHPIAEAPRTPKTSLQLALATKQPKSAGYVPFGRDFEDTDAYSPVISRLLFLC